MENKTAIVMVRNLVFRDEKKHIECGCDFLRETIRDRSIITSRVTSDKLTAILSNAFTNLTCISIRGQRGLIDIHLSTVNG